MGNRICSFSDCNQPVHVQRAGLCNGHYRQQLKGNPLRPLRSNVRGRFLEKVRVRRDGCWVWVGSLNGTGYGSAWIGKRATGAHRASWLLFVGPIPNGLELDHLCRNRACVNPDHLEPVTRTENVRRGIAGAVRRQLAAEQTHCKNGHPLSGENLQWSATGGRLCRTCRRVSRSASYARRKQSAS